MTKRTSKTSQPKKPRAKATKGHVGGARPGSGPKPKLGVGAVRSVIKTVRLSAGEHDAQLAAVVRAGAKDWAEWARPILNAAADGASQVSIMVDGEPVAPVSGGFDRLQMSQVEAASGPEPIEHSNSQDATTRPSEPHRYGEGDGPVSG